MVTGMFILCLYEIQDPAKTHSCSLSVSIHRIFLNNIILKWDFFSCICQLSRFCYLVLTRKNKISVIGQRKYTAELENILFIRW